MPLSRNGFLKVTVSRRERIVMTAFRKRRSARCTGSMRPFDRISHTFLARATRWQGNHRFSARYCER